MSIDPMHAARLAQLEGALLALLHAAQAETDPEACPDAITAHMGPYGLDLTFTLGGVPLFGEGS